VLVVETTLMTMSRNFRNDAPCSGFVLISPTIFVVLHHSKVNFPLETLSRIKKITNVDVFGSPAARSSDVFLQKNGALFVL
jgi:hypothetical protein